MALVNQDGKVLVKNGKLVSGSACCDTVININYYACTGSNGCEAMFGPAPDFTTYETLEACQQQCAYLGVICEEWNYYENTYYECRGPQYGMPGGQMGPATCEDCNPECCPVTIPGTCFGSGANASIVADDQGFGASGTITEVLLTRPGAGYAKFGRVQPTLVISGANAAFQLSPRAGQFPCELPYWTIDFISIPPNSPITRLGVQGNGRGGYVDGDRLVIGATNGIVEQAAHAKIHTALIPPTLTLEVQHGGGGLGAVLVPTFAEFISQDAGGLGGAGATAGRRLFTISSIEITSPGSGYVAFDLDTLTGDFVTVNVTSGWSNPRMVFFAYVESVDENGAITAVTILERPANDPMPPLTSYSGGFEDFVITGVTVLCGGRYYAEDPSLPPYVSPVTVSITCRSGVTGTNAIIEAVVDDDTASETFGQIAELILVNGGNGYAGSCENEFP